MNFYHATKLLVCCAFLPILWSVAFLPGPSLMGIAKVGLLTTILACAALLSATTNYYQHTKPTFRLGLFSCIPIAAVLVTVITAQILQATLPLQAWDALDFWLVAGFNERLDFEFPFSGDEPSLIKYQRHPLLLVNYYGFLLDTGMSAGCLGIILSVMPILTGLLLCIALMTWGGIGTKASAQLNTWPLLLLLTPIVENHIPLYGYSELYLAMGCMAIAVLLAKLLQQPADPSTAMALIVTTALTASFRNTAIVNLLVIYVAFFCVVGLKMWGWKKISLIIFASGLILAVMLALNQLDFQFLGTRYAIVVKEKVHVYGFGRSGVMPSFNVYELTDTLMRSLFQNLSFTTSMVCTFMTMVLGYQNRSRRGVDFVVIFLALAGCGLMLVHIFGILVFRHFANNAQPDFDTLGTRSLIPLTWIAAAYLGCFLNKPCNTLLENDQI